MIYFLFLSLPSVFSVYIFFILSFFSIYFHCFLLACIIIMFVGINSPYSPTYSAPNTVWGADNNIFLSFFIICCCWTWLVSDGHPEASGVYVKADLNWTNEEVQHLSGRCSLPHRNFGTCTETKDWFKVKIHHNNAYLCFHFGFWKCYRHSGCHERGRRFMSLWPHCWDVLLQGCMCLTLLYNSPLATNTMTIY